MIDLDPRDTIAAIASPPGPALRGIVRLSGPLAPAIASEGFEPDDRPPARTGPPSLSRGWLRVAGLRPSLPALILTWPGPRSFTGQPAAEVHTVGSPPLLDLVLAHCLALGARPAHPGEFTLRAFLSGRIDLTRAEAVAGVIDARTPAQLGHALRQLAGGVAGPIEHLRDRLLDVLAHLEAGLDFVDEADVDPLARTALADELAEASAALVALAGRIAARDRVEGRPRVVLVGPPNAGKSRLFNALVGAERAIVSPIAGTTRDALVALCRLDGREIDLIDTAGAEPSSSPLASQAQGQRIGVSGAADLLLVCRSADSGPAGDLPEHRPRIEVWTKTDLAPAEPGTLPTSAATGEGLDALRRAILAALGAVEADDPMVGSGARCREAITRAGEALDRASWALAAGGGDELVAIDLRQSADELGKVVGAVGADAILDRIFRRFCIGK